MPAEIVTMEDCQSNYGVFLVPSNSHTKLLYNVTLNGSEEPAHCTCKAFHYSRGRTCKHIELVHREACLYNPQWREKPLPPNIRPSFYVYDAVSENPCPCCGGPMVYVRRAI